VCRVCSWIWYGNHIAPGNNRRSQAARSECQRLGGGKSATPIVLKLGLHAGSCIAVTTGDVLDYFGATVNIAARLEHQCGGGEVIASEAVAKDAAAGAALEDRTLLEETATLRGVSAPVRFVRVEGLRRARLPVDEL